MLVRTARLQRRSRFRSASRRSPGRSGVPRAAGSRRRTPTSSTSTRWTRAVTSPLGRNRNSSQKRSAPRSSRCADQPARGRRATPACRRPADAGGTARPLARAPVQEGIVMTVRWRAPAGLHVASARLPDEGELPSLDGATGWLNSPPLTAAGLRGKVVLAGFWTYTCINWLRQLPYLRAWASKYSGHGLVVIGVHTPEFPFEYDVANVRRAVRDRRIDYPVAIDNDYGIWT